MEEWNFRWPMVIMHEEHVRIICIRTAYIILPYVHSYPLDSSSKCYQSSYAASIIRHYQGCSLSNLATFIVVVLQARSVLVTGQASQAEDSNPGCPPGEDLETVRSKIHQEIQTLYWLSSEIFAGRDMNPGDVSDTLCPWTSKFWHLPTNVPCPSLYVMQKPYLSRAPCSVHLTILSVLWLRWHSQFTVSEL